MCCSPGSILIFYMVELFLIRARTISHVIDWNNVQHFLIIASATCWCLFLKDFLLFSSSLYFFEKEYIFVFWPVGQTKQDYQRRHTALLELWHYLNLFIRKVEAARTKRFIVRNHFKEVTVSYLLQKQRYFYVFVCLCAVGLQTEMDLFSKTLESLLKFHSLNYINKAQPRPSRNL